MFVRFTSALSVFAVVHALGVESWKPLLENFEYEWTFTLVPTAKEDFDLGCIRVKFNTKDWKPAIQAQTDIEEPPTVDLSNVEPPEDAQIVDDEEWARQYWKGPLLLMHGMNSDADDWMYNSVGPHKVLPFLLADIGYEVWVCNNRGTQNYS